MINVMILGILV